MKCGLCRRKIAPNGQSAIQIGKDAMTHFGCMKRAVREGRIKVADPRMFGITK